MMSLLNGILGGLGGEGVGGLDIGKLTSSFGDGGLEGLVGQLSQGGLGDVVQSWVGNGQNLPISLDQLQGVLGSEQVKGIAAAIGVDPSQIADMLPGFIDQLTPGGKLPDGVGDAVSGMLGGLFKS
ncbi:YidB family protein [Asticcacaulis sp. YBE204]|uniref:YidB family protein n=1 Tax=Asticcacaulis sp. YBE204 TaxID=1282363 RepID=UPI001F19B229|nr:YidB family protein [Asticcacaulis sp. YBE204]